MNKEKSKYKFIDMNTAQLNEQNLLLSKELFNLRFQKASGELKNTSRFSIVKKNIARIKTEISVRSIKGDN